MDKNGFIYFITNQSMPSLVKIGFTTSSVENRVSQLNSTGVPAAFELQACFFVKSAQTVESEIHKLLDQYRYAANREFFSISLPQAYELVLPVIIRECCDDRSAQQLTSHTRHKLDSLTTRVLQSLAGPDRAQGYPIYDLYDEKKEAGIDIEVCLANLLEMKLVKHSASKGNHRQTLWNITPKGIKFLSDGNLIDDWMRNERWYG